jgi:general secretion pathway protein I
MLKTRGFTLVEIMIALAIFAIVSAALIRNASLSVYQTGLIKDRTIAWWVAENKLNEMRAIPRDPENYPSTGRKSYLVRMADRDWDLQVEVVATENKSMRRIEITVFQDGDLDTPVVNLSGFIGEH